MRIAVRAITFDVGGTLDGPGVPWRPRFEALYRGAGIAVADEVLARAFYDADDHLHERHALAGLDLEATVRLQVTDTLGRLGRSSPELIDRVTGAFVREARTSLSSARPLLERLRREFRLGIVSNSYGNLRDVIRLEGLLDLFDVVVDSREAGFEKPDPRIFHLACEALGAPPQRVAHVGDSVPRDVEGARGAGLVPVWYAPASIPGVAPGATRIHRLEELEGILAAVNAA